MLNDCEIKVNIGSCSMLKPQATQRTLKSIELMVENLLNEMFD